MSESIEIGNLSSGNTIIGGTGNTISGSGTVNVYGDQLLRLRALLDDLIRAIDESGAPPGARAAADMARAEAAKPCPEPGRLRRLIGSVMDRAKDVATVSQAALNILSVMTMIEHGAH